LYDIVSQEGVEMVDNLKSSLEGLEPPVCPACGKQMIWIWSQLVEHSPVVIEHEFVCESCGGTNRRKVVQADKSIRRPGKLSLPRPGRAA